MIIDAHCHLFREDWLPQGFWEEFAGFLAAASARQGRALSPEKVREELLPSLWDPTGEKQIRAMDEAGINVAAVVLLDYGLLYGEPPVPIEEQNRQLAVLAQRWPGRLLPFVGVDPRRKGAVELLERGVKAWGMRGLKIHPSAGFYPNGPEAYALFEVAQRLDIPVATHTGMIMGSLKARYSHPLHLDDVLSDFPRLKLIAVHLGDTRGAYWPEVASLAWMRPNLYLDLCGWQGMARRNYPAFCQILRSVLDIAGADRLLLGTDGPVNRAVLSDREWVALIRELPQKAPAGLTFRQEEVEAILGGNARRLFGM
ncbi:MAG: amidohydrolase [Candidatus Tectomicrobia bacterium]|uniref:Amidohydrolase n=1 Tax=Tectimicrobiota bacterium TaxID=2528274 RepID=A0A932FZJ6_UNCTE|nr:amidohydrolase [Candidatus Tectomicrobia bacterium]